MEKVSVEKNKVVSKPESRDCVQLDKDALDEAIANDGWIEARQSITNYFDSLNHKEKTIMVWFFTAIKNQVLPDSVWLVKKESKFYIAIDKAIDNLSVRFIIKLDLNNVISRPVEEIYVVNSTSGSGNVIRLTNEVSPDVSFYFMSTHNKIDDPQTVLKDKAKREFSYFPKERKVEFSRLRNIYDVFSLFHEIGHSRELDEDYSYLVFLSRAKDIFYSDKSRQEKFALIERLEKEYNLSLDEALFLRSKSERFASEWAINRMSELKDLGFSENDLVMATSYYEYNWQSYDYWLTLFPTSNKWREFIKENPEFGDLFIRHFELYDEIVNIVDELSLFSKNNQLKFFFDGGVLEISNPNSDMISFSIVANDEFIQINLHHIGGVTIFTSLSNSASFSEEGYSFLQLRGEEGLDVESIKKSQDILSSLYNLLFIILDKKENEALSRIRLLKKYFEPLFGNEIDPLNTWMKESQFETTPQFLQRLLNGESLDFPNESDRLLGILRTVSKRLVILFPSLIGVQMPPPNMNIEGAWGLLAQNCEIIVGNYHVNGPDYIKSLGWSFPPNEKYIESLFRETARLIEHIDKLNCPKCHVPVAIEYRFCTNCGTRLT